MDLKRLSSRSKCCTVHWNLGIFSTCIRNGFVGMKNGDCGLSVDDASLVRAGGVRGVDVPGEEPLAFRLLTLADSLAKGETVLLKDSDPDAMSKGEGMSLTLVGLLGVDEEELGWESSFIDSCSSLAL